VACATSLPPWGTFEADSFTTASWNAKWGLIRSIFVCCLWNCWVGSGCQNEKPRNREDVLNIPDVRRKRINLICIDGVSRIDSIQAELRPARCIYRMPKAPANANTFRQMRRPNTMIWCKTFNSWVVVLAACVVLSNLVGNEDSYLLFKVDCCES